MTSDPEILTVVENGYYPPFQSPPWAYFRKNNQSAMRELPFIVRAVSELLINGFAKLSPTPPPLVTNPFSVSTRLHHSVAFPTEIGNGSASSSSINHSMIPTFLPSFSTFPKKLRPPGKNDDSGFWEYCSHSLQDHGVAFLTQIGNGSASSSSINHSMIFVINYLSFIPSQLSFILSQPSPQIERKK